VTDESGAFAVQSFVISVENTNDAPVFTSEAITTATEDAEYSYIVIAEDVDVGDEISLSEDILPSWLVFSPNDDGTGILSGTPLNANVGDNTVVLRVTDESGAFAVQSFVISVENTNDIPVFISEAITEATEDVEYIYRITADDVDVGDAVSITASTIPDWLNLVDNDDGTGRVSGMPLNANVGDNTVVLRVTDESGAFAVQSFVISVENTNDAPTISLPDNLTFAEDGFLTEDFSEYIEDVDGDVLELTVTGNEEISVDIVGYMVTFTASLNWNGSETLTFYVEDESGETLR
jgi:hypothetical protein